MQNLTDSDAIILGAYCEDLMCQELFNTLYSLFKEEAFDKFASSAFYDKETRDIAYSELQGVQSFLGFMTRQVNKRNTLLQPEEETPSSVEEVEDDAYQIELNFDD